MITAGAAEAAKPAKAGHPIHAPNHNAHSGPSSASLHERAVKALADITDSPAGLLLMPNDTVYYLVSDNGEFGFADALAESHRLKSMFPASAG